MFERCSALCLAASSVEEHEFALVERDGDVLVHHRRLVIERAPQQEVEPIPLYPVPEFMKWARMGIRVRRGIGERVEWIRDHMRLTRNPLASRTNCSPDRHAAVVRLFGPLRVI